METLQQLCVRVSSRERRRILELFNHTQGWKKSPLQTHTQEASCWHSSITLGFCSGPFGPQLMAQTQEGPAWNEQNSNPPLSEQGPLIPQPPPPPHPPTQHTPHPCRWKHTHTCWEVHAHTHPQDTHLTCWFSRRAGPYWENVGIYGSGAFSEVWQGKTGMQHDLRHWKLATGLYIEPILLTDLGYNQCLHLELIMYLV